MLVILIRTYLQLLIILIGVAGNHKAVELQTELEEQAKFDTLVGIERQPAFEYRMGPGVQPGA